MRPQIEISIHDKLKLSQHSKVLLWCCTIKRETRLKYTEIGTSSIPQVSKTAKTPALGL